MNKEFQLSPNSLSQLASIDNSINHWSVEYSKTALSLRGMEVQLAGLYESRDAFLKQLVEVEAQVPASQVSKIELLNGGAVRVVLKPNPSNPEPPVPPSSGS